MVYGRYGREPLQRLVDAIGLVSDPVKPLEERLRPARLLAEVADRAIFKDTPWEETAEVDDIEFVDRCLHVNEQSYDIGNRSRGIDHEFYQGKNEGQLLQPHGLREDCKECGRS